MLLVNLEIVVGLSRDSLIKYMTSFSARFLYGFPYRFQRAFLVYINDIVDAVSTGTTIRLFADDCLMYRPLRKNNEDEDQCVLQRDLDALEAWADKWGMRFNQSKCQIMQVKRGNSPPKLHLYELMDTVLQNVTKAKYLGVWLSSNLDWDHQIGTATNKANTSLHFISRNLSGCSRSTREHAVRSLTMPHL